VIADRPTGWKSSPSTAGGIRGRSGGWPTFDARSEGEAQGKTAWAKALTYFNGTAT
jgi:hypothetical protein